MPGDSSVSLMQLQKELDATRSSLVDAHRQLLKSEKLLLDLLERAADGICVLEDRSVYFVNPRLCEMMGCTAEDLIGADFTHYLSSDELDRTLRLYKRMINSESFPQRYETVLLTPGGDRLEVGVSADLIALHGRSGIMITVRDISAHRRVRQMAVENERLEALLTVAQGVGSNFANALGIIRSSAGAIADSFLPNTRPHDAARKILDASEHAAEMVKRLLSVVRISGSDASSHIEAVSLGVSLQKARDLLGGGLQERGIRIQIPQDPRPWYVQADAGQLLDVLMNVLLNAADAMPQGGSISILIQRRALPDAMDLPLEGVDELVELTVGDTGVGMTPEQIQKAFEPFFTTKSDKHALGLGLSVAQQVLKRWGGWIEIEAAPDRGTNVKLLVPKAIEQNGHPLEVCLTGGRTLLVIEDQPERRRMMVQTLLEDGHAVLEADNGDQALRLFMEHADQIALTVLDWIIPGTDGGSVLRKIQEYDPDARVLLVSGFSKDYVRSQIQRGAWAFLQKPFSVEALREAVQKTLPPPRCLFPLAENGEAG